MTYGTCSSTPSKKDEGKKEECEYRCGECGVVSDKKGECCGQPKEKICSSDSDEHEESCCK